MYVHSAHRYTILSVVMLNVTLYCYAVYRYAKRCDAKCRYTEFHYTECRSAKKIVTIRSIPASCYVSINIRFLVIGITTK